MCMRPESMRGAVLALLFNLTVSIVEAKYYRHLISGPGCGTAVPIRTRAVC